MKTIARLLRRLANRIDPQPRYEVVTPVEFIASQELAREIGTRSDVYVMFWGRATDDGQFWNIVGEGCWSIRSNQVQPLMEILTKRILSEVHPAE